MENNKRISLWDYYAECYDVLNELHPYQDLHAEVIDNLLPAFNNPFVLDVACGTGNFPFWLKKMQKSQGYVVTGLDNSDGMIKKAKGKNPEKNLFFRKHDLNEKLPFDDGFFDQVVSVNTLYSVEDPLKMILEFSRVVKEKGRLILVNPKKGYENGLIMKEHCRDKGADAPWLQCNLDENSEKNLLEKVIEDNEVRKKMSFVVKINRQISKENTFHFYTLNDFSLLVGQSGLLVLDVKKVYADQAIMIVAEK